jgi:hypothetical protein
MQMTKIFCLDVDCIVLEESTRLTGGRKELRQGFLAVPKFGGLHLMRLLKTALKLYQSSEAGLHL